MLREGKSNQRETGVQGTSHWEASSRCSKSKPCKLYELRCFDRRKFDVALLSYYEMISRIQRKLECWQPAIGSPDHAARSRNCTSEGTTSGGSTGQSSKQLCAEDFLTKATEIDQEYLTGFEIREWDNVWS